MLYSGKRVIFAFCNHFSLEHFHERHSLVPPIKTLAVRTYHANFTESTHIISLYVPNLRRKFHSALLEQKSAWVLPWTTSISILLSHGSYILFIIIIFISFNFLFHSCNTSFSTTILLIINLPWEAHEPITGWILVFKKTKTKTFSFGYVIWTII